MAESDAVHRYVGKCGCGGLVISLESGLAAGQFQPRSDGPTCGFCREHDGVWISDPGGTLELRPADVTSVRSFASEQVAFHFCPSCGELAYALFAEAPGGREVAVTRVALFEAIRAVAQPTSLTSFEGESVEIGRQRRLARWTPVRRR